MYKAKPLHIVVMLMVLIASCYDTQVKKAHALFNAEKNDTIIPIIKPTNKAELITEIKKAIAAKGNNVDLNYIDTSDITDMGDMFNGATAFNSNISKWDVSKVVSMIAMFQGAASFTHNLEQWNERVVPEVSRHNVS